MEDDFDHIDELDGGDVIAIGDPTAVILPAERNANEILAQIIMDGRRKIGTRNSYNKKISAFLKWLQECHPVHFDEASGSAILPVPPKIIAEFMAKISTVVDRKTKEPRSAAVSQVGSYRSALVQCCDRRASYFTSKKLFFRINLAAIQVERWFRAVLSRYFQVSKVFCINLMGSMALWKDWNK